MEREETVRRLARGFVEEYLEEVPEFLSVWEYVDDNIENPDAAAMDDDIYKDIHQEVAAIMDVIAQRFADTDN